MKHVGTLYLKQSVLLNGVNCGHLKAQYTPENGPCILGKWNANVIQTMESNLVLSMKAKIERIILYIFKCAHSQNSTKLVHCV